MAKRPIFIPSYSHYPYTKEIIIDFEWYPGFAKTQAQKSIQSLHNEAKKRGISPILEISSKSLDSLGVSLSAFNLTLTVENLTMSVECAFQGSKVFKNGGPYTDLYRSTSIEAKKNVRIKESGELIGFNFLGMEFPTRPFTLFYDWIYLIALSQNPTLSERMLKYSGFSDIAFNPEHSINCQARSAALFVALSNSSEIDMNLLISDKNHYLEVMGEKNQQYGRTQKNPNQLGFSF